MTLRNASPAAVEPVSLQRIRRTSLLLARFCLVLIIGLPVLAVIFWMGSDQGSLAAYSHISPTDIERPLLTWQRITAAAITLVPLGLALTGLAHARRCFHHFAQGRYFELIVIEHLRRFAAWTWGSVAASFLAMPALSVLLTFYNAPGHRQLAVALSSELLFTFFIAGLVWLIAAVMTHAHVLAEENAQFV